MTEKNVAGSLYRKGPGDVDPIEADEGGTGNQHVI